MIYCNIAIIFTKEKSWSFHEFINTHSEDTEVHLELPFHQQLTGNLQDTEEIELKAPEQNIQFPPHQRNYTELFRQFVDYSLYTEKVTLGELSKLLISNGFVNECELIIYRHFMNEYIVESGRQYGVPLMLYDKKDIQHKHSQYLVDYCKQETYMELYRKIRIAQDVKKQLLMVIIQDNKVISIRKIRNS